MNGKPRNDYCPHGRPDFGRGCRDCRPDRLVVGRYYVLETRDGVTRIRPRARRGAAFVGGICAVALGAIVLGLSTPAKASSTSSSVPPACAKRYPLPPVFGYEWITGRPLYAHPLGLDFTRCLFREGMRNYTGRLPR